MRAYFADQLSHHSVPRAVVFPRAVLAVLDKDDLVGERTHLCNLLRQLRAESVEAAIFAALLVVRVAALLDQIWRSLFERRAHQETHVQCNTKNRKFMACLRLN